MTLEGIDLVLFINLDKRTDRRAETESEIRRLGIPESKIVRSSAIQTDRGIVGCGISHVNALNSINSLPDNIQTVMILEDDFSFIEDIDLVRRSLQKFLSYPRESWDIALLSYWITQHEDYDDLMSISLYAHGTAGYLVNRQGLQRFLTVMQEGVDGMLRTGEEQYVIDIYWNRFMKSRRCFYFNTALGYQRESYSDVRNAVGTFKSRVG